MGEKKKNREKGQKKKSGAGEEAFLVKQKVVCVRNQTHQKT